VANVVTEASHCTIVVWWTDRQTDSSIALRIDLLLEIDHIQTWAAGNLMLNCSKSKEIIFTARGKRGKSVQLPSPCLDIERVSSQSPRRDMTSLQRPTTCPTYWRRATVCYTRYGSCAVMASQTLRYMISFVLLSSRSWPTVHHRGPVRALPPTVLSDSHSSADARDLNTAAVKCQHTVILLMKLTILFSLESWPTMDMFIVSLSRPSFHPFQSERTIA